MKFIEIGIGNDSFVSTEIEEYGREYRVKGFVKIKKRNDLYFRIWLNRTVWIFSSRDGVQKSKKEKSAFKLLIGVSGE